MADSAPTTSAERQSVGAHHRIGMRRVAQLALPRPTAINSVVAGFLLLSLFISNIAAATPQLYIVCKEFEFHRCLTLQTESKADVAGVKNLYPKTDFANHCFISNAKPYPGIQKFITVTSFSTRSKRRLFCKSNNVLNVGALDGTTLETAFEGLYRVRRDASYSPRGRFRGQTQSQYLAIERGSTKDEGKAEAHSAADSSRATVSGNSGMGQAQSQSMYDPSCEDCVGGRSDLGAESLKRRPGETSIQGGTPGSTGLVISPGEVGGVGPGQIIDPTNRGYGVNTNQGGTPGTDYSGLYGQPGGNGRFGPGIDGTQGGSSLFPSQGNQARGNNNGVVSPNGQSGFGTKPDGGSSGMHPPYLYNQNGIPTGINDGGPRGNNIGIPPGSIPFSKSGYGSKQPSLEGDSTHGGPEPRITGTYGVPGGLQDANGNIIPGTQLFGFSPGGSSGGGNMPPVSLTQPQNGGGSYSPSQNSRPGNNGIYPIQGGIQSGFPQTSGASPSGTNWFRGADGLNYYCCIASPNGPQLGDSGFKPTGTLPNQYSPGSTAGQRPSVQFGPGTGGGVGPAGQFGPAVSDGQGPVGQFVPGTGSGSSGQFGPGAVVGQGTGGRFGPGTGSGQGTNGLFGPGTSGGQGTGGQFSPSIGGDSSRVFGPRTGGGQYGPGTLGGQGTGGQFGPATGGQYGPGSLGGHVPSSQFSPGATGGQGPGGQFTPGGAGGTLGPGAQGGQFRPEVTSGPGVGGLYGPGTSSGTGQFGPGSGGGHGVNGQYSPGTPGGHGTGGSTGGQFGPGTGIGTGGQYSPGTGAYGGQFGPGAGSGIGIGEQFRPGTGSGTSGQFGPGTGGGAGSQFSPGANSGQGTGGQFAPGTGGGTGIQYGPGAGGEQGTGGKFGPGIQYGPGAGGEQGTGGKFGPGPRGGYGEQIGPGTGGEQGTGRQFGPGTGSGSGGQLGPGAGTVQGIGGQFAPGTGSSSGGQFGPGEVGTGIPFGPGTGSGSGGLFGPGAVGGQGIGGQFGPGISSGTGGQLGPGAVGGQGANGPFSPGIGSGSGGQFGPGAVGGQGNGRQFGPNTGSGFGGQFRPGVVGGQGTSGQFAPGVGSGQGTVTQLGPGTGNTNGGQFSPGVSGGQFVPGTGSSSGGVFGPGAGGGQGTGGQFGPGTGSGAGGLFGPGAGSAQFGPGTGSGSGGQFGPGVGGGQGTGGEQFGPGIGGNTGGQFGPGVGGGQFGPGPGSGSGGVFGPGAAHGQGTGGEQFGPGIGGNTGGQFGPGVGASQGTDGVFGPGTGGSSSGQLGPGAAGGQGTSIQFGPGMGGGQGNAGQFGPGQGSGVQYPGAQYHPYGDQYGSSGSDNKAPPGGSQNAPPQNVIDPNSIADGDDSEAEASVSQATNGTIASASSKGGDNKGRAQTNVHGTYTGSGSFSAQAEISGENKAANSEVTGDKKGASSTAQGSGRNNKSQANVKLGSETGSVLTGSQSEGVLHSSNSQVQGSVKGGMADAQARGPGSTSSQAQIGFTPYKDGDKSHELQKSPFVGGGIASAQSSGRTGMSQSQLHGTFKYGITYNGAAQAGASLNKDAVFPNRLPFDKIDVFDENNKNVNVNDENVDNTEETDLSSVLPTELPTTEVLFDIGVTELNKDDEINQPDDQYSIHKHADHHTSDDPLSAPTRSPPIESRRSFQLPDNTNNGDYEYSTDKDDSPPDDYDVDDGFGPEGNDPAETEQSYMNNSYNEFSRDPEATHQSLHTPKRKGLEVRQTTGGNTQHILLGSLTDHDAEITQRNSERPDESKIYQPGERVPGTGGYTIPVGFTGSVKSVASKDKTYVVGSKESPSQAQTVSLTPGNGRVNYKHPPYGRNINPKNLRSLYNSKPDDNNRYVSVSKSVTRAMDGENNIRKQYSHTYYTKSSSCGYFTFTCTMVSSAEGRKKVCKPKMPINPDGTPMRCN